MTTFFVWVFQFYRCDRKQQRARTKGCQVSLVLNPISRDGEHHRDFNSYTMQLTFILLDQRNNSPRERRYLFCFGKPKYVSKLKRPNHAQKPRDDAGTHSFYEQPFFFQGYEKDKNTTSPIKQNGFIMSLLVKETFHHLGNNL